MSQKEERGESFLSELDVNMLEFENQQYREKIEERNQELGRLEVQSGRTLRLLNTYKKKLGAMTSDLDRTRADIAAKHALVQQIETDTQIVEQVHRVLCE